MENPQTEISTEKTILSGLVNREDYLRKVLPYLKKKYFESNRDQLAFELIDDYVIKYNQAPQKESLILELKQKENISEDLFQQTHEFLGSIFTDETKTFIVSANLDWMIKTTENYCKNRALYLAIMDSITIIDGKKKEKGQTIATGAIPQILQDALAVSFDPNIGHDYLGNAEDRYKFYHVRQRKVKTRIEMLNRILKGGFTDKSLSLFIGPTGKGKTIVLTSLAADNLLDGYNVLYITLEMAEEKIAERIDANLMDVKLNDIEGVPKEIFMKKVDSIKSKTIGRLVIKEYPTSAASVLHFKALLNELKLKKSFKPDIIYIDYLNICDSAKITSAQNMYELMKKIAEELRGLAIEFSVPVVSATQVNREGAKASDYEMTDISESFGMAMTVDVMLGIISTDALDQLGQMRLKQFKNRFWDINSPKSFLVGLDKPKMRVYNLENSMPETAPESPQQSITKPTIDSKRQSSSFEGFKF